MSVQYDERLKVHNTNVRKAYFWFKRSLPEILIDIPGVDYSWYIDFHDDSKTIPDEYNAYDEYLFGEQTKETEARYLRAKLDHRHRNPHHWEYWVLYTSDKPPVALDMEYPYIIEMICDWWSFSWAEGDLFAIFDWYEKHRKNIRLSKKTRATVEDILDKLEAKLIKVRGPRK